MPAKPPPPFFSTAVKRSRRFFLDLAPPATTELAVVCGGYEECSQDYDLSRESFPYFSMELVTGGKGWLTLAGSNFKLQPGSVFTYGPGIPHRIRTSPRSRIAKYFVDFCGTGAGTMLAAAGLALGNCTRVFPHAEVQVVFNELLRDGARNDRLAASLCEAWLRGLALRIAASSVAEPEGKATSWATYRRCVAFIESNAARVHSQQQLAEECGVAPAYLCRLFKRYGRRTPYQYLTGARMNLAAERLLDKSIPVQQVAEEMGFSDPFHFSRAFKANYGVSPSQFRSLR